MLVYHNWEHLEYNNYIQENSYMQVTNTKQLLLKTRNMVYPTYIGIHIMWIQLYAYICIYMYIYILQRYIYIYIIYSVYHINLIKSCNLFHVSRQNQVISLKVRNLVCLTYTGLIIYVGLPYL